MDKKIHWGKEVVLAIVFAIIIIILMNLYCNWKSKDRLTMKYFEEKCEERGLEFSYYIGYPDSDSIKIGCKNVDYMGFKEVIINLTGQDV